LLLRRLAGQECPQENGYCDSLFAGETTWVINTVQHGYCDLLGKNVLKKMLIGQEIT